MAANQDDVKRWIQTGIRNGSKYLVSICDTFDWDDYPVYCANAVELDQVKIKYDGVNMQRINEIIDLDEHRKLEESDHYPDNLLSSLPEILVAINASVIEAGMNKNYCFVTDEDGHLVFLKRPKNAVVGQPNIAEDEDDSDHLEIRTQWPYNSRDGQVLYRQYCGENRGTTIAEDFLRALNIDYLG